MRPVHYISIVAALALVALLYWGVNTVPPAKKGGEMPGMAGGAQGPQHTDEPASFDSLLAAANKQLPQHASDDIRFIEKELESAKDSASMSQIFTRLAQQWQQHKQLPIAAYYYAKSAKLENSEKNLNFAGQFFLELLQQERSESVKMWEASEAVDCFQRSLAINPDNDTTKLALAASYIEGAGETMQGVQMLLGITRENPDNIPANLMLGRLSVQSGQFDKAIQRFETILKQEPENREALYFMAEAYKGKGDKQKAIALFEQTKKVVNSPEFSKDIDQYINSFK